MASFYVSHTEKFNAGGLKGIGIHNERKSQNSKNQDIDKNRSHLNYDLHKGDNQISYEAEVNKIIKKNYTSNRKIRANAVIMTSTIISASPEFFENKPQEEIKKYFEMNYEYLKERIGENNVISATVHMDEKTPHMHFCSVPITTDGRLCAKEIYDREALRELQSEPVELVREIYPEIERGKVNHTGKSKHVDSEVFKALEAEKALKELQNKEQTYRTLQELKRAAKKKKSKNLNNLIFTGNEEYTVSEKVIDDLISKASQVDQAFKERDQAQKSLDEYLERNRFYEKKVPKLEKELEQLKYNERAYKKRLEKAGLNTEVDTIEEAVKKTLKKQYSKNRSKTRGLER